MRHLTIQSILCVFKQTTPPVQFSLKILFSSDFTTHNLMYFSFMVLLKLQCYRLLHFYSLISFFSQSSTSVSLQYSQSPELTVTSTVTSDLLSPSDLIEWANQKNISNVTSYTEADLANRFVVKLRGGGQGEMSDGIDSCCV